MLFGGSTFLCSNPSAAPCVTAADTPAKYTSTTCVYTRIKRIHIHIERIHTRTRQLIRTFTNAQRDGNSEFQTHIITHTHVHTHTYTHTHTHTHSGTATPSFRRPSSPAKIATTTGVCVYTHIHTLTHTHENCNDYRLYVYLNISCTRVWIHTHTHTVYT